MRRIFSNPFKMQRVIGLKLIGWDLLKFNGEVTSSLYVYTGLPFRPF
jgi:hypothetical protein